MSASCSNSKDGGNDQILGDDISSFDAMELPFANHVHYLKASRCSGSTTVGVGLANGGRFGLTLCDNGLGSWLMLSANGLTLTDKGSTTAHPAHAQ